MDTCPKCHSEQNVGKGYANDKALYCRKCGIEFESDDDGDISYGSPSRRMERQERRDERRKAVKG